MQCRAQTTTQSFTKFYKKIASKKETFTSNLAMRLMLSYDNKTDKNICKTEIGEHLT